MHEYHELHAMCNRGSQLTVRICQEIGLHLYVRICMNIMSCMLCATEEANSLLGSAKKSALTSTSTAKSTKYSDCFQMVKLQICDNVSSKMWLYACFMSGEQRQVYVYQVMRTYVIRLDTQKSETDTCLNRCMHV
jgi:hypothetical protein